MVGFIKENDFSYAGRHLLVDLYGCTVRLTPDQFKDKLEIVCNELGATVLYGYAHDFNNGGSSGAIILAESHCTWHYWIEEEYIAIDIFVCGECQPEQAINSLVNIFKPTQTKTSLHLRGIINSIQ